MRPHSGTARGSSSEARSRRNPGTAVRCRREIVAEEFFGLRDFSAIFDRTHLPSCRRCRARQIFYHFLAVRTKARRLPAPPAQVKYRGLAKRTDAMNILLMKRTNLVLDEDLLEEATRLSGEKTYSRTVSRALAEFVLRYKARQILTLAGSGAWSGDIGEMRRDRSRPGRESSR